MKRVLAVASLLGVGMSVPINLSTMELCTADEDCRVFGDTRAYCNIPDATKRANNGEITTADALVAQGAGTVGQCTCGTYTAAEQMSFGAYNNIAHCFPSTEPVARTNARTLLVSLGLQYVIPSRNCNHKSYLADFEEEARRVITRYTTGMQITVSCGTRYQTTSNLFITISANMTIGEIINTNFLGFADTLEARYPSNSMYFMDNRGALRATLQFHSQPAMFMRCPSRANTTFWSYHGTIQTTYPPLAATPTVNHVVSRDKCLSNACVAGLVLVNGDCFAVPPPPASDDDLTDAAIGIIALVSGLFLCCIISTIVWCCCCRSKYYELQEKGN